MKGCSTLSMTIRRGVLVAWVLGAVAFPVVTLAATPPLAQQQVASRMPAGVERVTSVEGITEYRLANGLRVLLFPDPSKQTITVNVTYEVGSRHENYGETGMAHLLEHLLFKGSPKHTNIPQELSEHGARPNGSTFYDRTNYFETFAATDENLRWALDLEADRMVNSYIAKKDLDSEMSVVRNEFESGENRPTRVLLQRVLSTAYLWHNYGKPTIGSRSDIENVPIERLQAFYRTFYQPDNAVLVVAGQIDEAKTLGLVSEIFGAVPRPTRVLPTFYTIEPTQDGERNVTLRRTGDLQYLTVGYHVPAGSHADFAVLDLLVDILTNEASGRLSKALVETKKASSVSGSDYQLHDPGMAVFQAEVRQDSSIESVRDTLVSIVEDAAKNPPTKEEFERARTSALKQIEESLNSSSRIGLDLSEWIAMGDWRLLFLYRDRLRAATAEDVQRVAASYFKASNRTIGMFLPTASPDRAEIPAVPDVAALVKDYKGDAAVAAGEAFDPSPANVEARTVRSVLPGGLKLALMSKKTRGATVVVDLTLRFGDERSLMNRSAAAELAGDMLMRGTSRHTRQQLEDELDRLKARVRINGGVTNATASIQTIHENLPAVLRLVAEMLREPSFPSSEFEQLKQQQLADLESQKGDPLAINGIAIQRQLRPFPKGHVRYVPTFEESIADVQAVSLDEAKKFFTDFYGASAGEMVVVGDFDARQIASVAGELFGPWKSPRPFVRVPDPFRVVPPVNQSIETPDKANASFAAGQNLNLQDDDPDYPALVLGNYMLGGGFLNSRLATRIRQKDGLSYNVGSGLQVSPLEKNGMFSVRAIYAPQNRDRLETAFKEEITRALQDGFTDDEVRTAKTGFLQSRQVGRAQDGELASRLGALLFLGRTMEWDAGLERRIQALTPAEIKAALARQLSLGKMTIIKAGDFAKAGAGK